MSKPPDSTKSVPPLSLGTLFSLSYLLFVNFAVFDLLRRLSDELEASNFGDILANTAAVGCLGAIVAFFLAVLLRFVDRIIKKASQPLLVFLFYTVNLTFAKYRVGEWFESLPEGQRQLLCLLAFLAAFPLGYLARHSLSDLRDAVSSGGKRLGLLILLPFAGGLVLASLLQSPERASPTTARTEGKGKRQPNILLLTMDTLAGRDMSLYGYQRPTTPNLSRFAQESINFLNAHSTSNTTNTSICAYEGFYFSSKVAGESLLDQLKKAGYRDNLWVSFHSPKFFGLDQPDQIRVIHSVEEKPLYKLVGRVLPDRSLVWLSGLLTEEWCYFVPYDPRVGVEYHHYWTREHFSEEKSLLVAMRHLQAARTSPTFVWVHLWQPHYPYLPRSAFKGAFGSLPLPYPPLINSTYPPDQQEVVDTLRRSYDEYVLDVDAAVGDFLDGLKADANSENTIVIIGSDHGESFERGWVGHGGSMLHEALNHIPLMMRFPGGPSGVAPESFATPLDVGPTLLEYLGLPVPKAWAGESLWPYIKDAKSRSPKPKLSVSYFAYTKEQGEIAVYSDKFKLVFTKENPGNIAVYDLSADPTESTNIYQKFGEQARAVVESVKWITAPPPGSK